VSDDPTAKLWAQAVEEHVAAMTEGDFSALVERTRPKPISDMTPRELYEQIAKKSAESIEKTKARANGGTHIAASLTTPKG
jgi:hypothetical protein